MNFISTAFQCRGSLPLQLSSHPDWGGFLHAPQPVPISTLPSSPWGIPSPTALNHIWTETLSSSLKPPWVAQHQHTVGAQ